MKIRKVEKFIGIKKYDKKNTSLLLSEAGLVSNTSCIAGKPFKGEIWE